MKKFKFNWIYGMPWIGYNKYSCRKKHIYDPTINYVLQISKLQITVMY